MRAMASQITNLILFTQSFIELRIKEKSKLRVTGLCEGNSPVTGEFPTQRSSNTENVSIWWRHHVPNGHSNAIYLLQLASRDYYNHQP